MAVLSFLIKKIKMNKKGIVYILAVLFLVNILAWLVVYDLSQPRFLEVIFFDVGQGEAIFVETPKRQQILIDGGPDSIILEKLSKEMPFWDRTIDLIVLTHPEYDHLVGLIEALKRYRIENILWTGIIRDTAEYTEWQSLIDKEGAKIFIAQAGTRIIMNPGLLEVFYPFENLESQKLKNSNDTSIIAKFIFENNSFLFTGDISKSIEKKLINFQTEKLKSNVLKSAHHGSKTSSSEEFIEKVLPEIAVISAGKENSYGHPHKEVLEILEKFGIKILRTDFDGDIKIISDGQKIKYGVSNF